MKPIAKDITLAMGEMATAKPPDTLSCLGIGSCIALFIYDNDHKIAVGGHIVISNILHPAAQLYYDSETMINIMLRQLQNQGGNMQRIRAKMAGGATIFKELKQQVGKKNIASVHEILIKKKIFIAASEVGGHLGRTVRFIPESGALEVSSGPNKKLRV